MSRFLESSVQFPSWCSFLDLLRTETPDRIVTESRSPAPGHNHPALASDFHRATALEAGKVPPKPVLARQEVSATPWATTVFGFRSCFHIFLIDSPREAAGAEDLTTGAAAAF